MSRGLRLLPWVLLLAIVLQIVSCGGGERAGGGQHVAEGFTLSERGLRVVDPRSPGRGVRYRRGEELSINDTLVTFAKIPNRVICLSSTHVAFMSALGLEDRVVGVSSGGFISNSRIAERLILGEVKDVGSDMALNYEVVVSLRPDVVLAYATSGPTPEFYGRLAALGIPVVMVGEYMERTPLARSEWVRAIGWLMGEEERADSLQRALAARYESAQRIVSGVINRPKVLLNAPWQETWYIPGGNTYLAVFIRDAGGEVLTAGNVDSDKSLPVSLERALALGMEADYWFHPGTAESLQDLGRQSKLFTLFPAFKTGCVWNNTLRLNANGGNDYFESGVLAPDEILMDMIAILHPELLPGHDFTYYKQLK